MTRLLQAIVIGLGQGSIYALLALGFVIIFKTTRIISFAQPAIMVVGACLVSFFAVSLGVPFVVAVGLAALLTAGMSSGLERLTLRPLLGRPAYVAVIVTLALDVGLRTLANRWIGPRFRTVGDPWGITTQAIGGVFVQQRHLVMLVTTALLVGLLGLFFSRTRTGLGMRAAAVDQEAALAQGIDVGRVISLAWGIAGALAAIAGMFVGTDSGISPSTFAIALKALPAMVLGGLDSLGGAVIGGLAIGVFEAMVATYQGQYAPFLGSNFSLVAPYVLMLAVLLVRPFGLFGTPQVERV